VPIARSMRTETSKLLVWRFLQLLRRVVTRCPRFIQPTVHIWTLKILVLYLGGRLCVACGEASGPEDRPADFSGIILALREQAASEHVLETVVERSVGDTAIVRVTQTTRIYARLADGGLQSVDRQVLAAGDSVEVWTTGVEYRSLPPQYDGRQLVVW
jgi:hypothetical protein